MELGLSLGDSRKSVDGLLKEKNTNQQKPTKKKCDLDFCMALSLNSYATLENDQENENDDHLQLHLLPIVPSHLQSSDNGKSSGNTVLPAARGSDVNRIPATAEEVSSANSTGSQFHMDFATYKSIGNENIRHGNKRDHIKASRNDVVEAKRASNDDENGLNTRKKLRLSKQQYAFLEESFKEHHTLNPKQKLALAKQLNLRPRQIEVWFQNRRARTKLKQTEVNLEHLKRCCEILTNENRRLHKELRALKTMCHSCQHVSTAPTVTVASTPKTLSFRQTRPRLIYPCPQNTC